MFDRKATKRSYKFVCCCLWDSADSEIFLRKCNLNMFVFVIILNYLFFDKEIEIEKISILVTHYNNIATELYTTQIMLSNVMYVL